MSNEKSVEVRFNSLFADPFLWILGSYGVVFKAMRTDQDDTDENGNRRQYAIKRIFPTINAAFILVEMLILKLVDGEKNNADLI